MQSLVLNEIYRGETACHGLASYKPNPIMCEHGPADNKIPQWLEKLVVISPEFPAGV